MEYTRELMQADTYVHMWVRNTPAWMSHADACLLFNVFDAKISGVQYDNTFDVSRCERLLSSNQHDYAANFVLGVLREIIPDSQKIAGKCEICGRFGTVYIDKLKRKTCTYCTERGIAYEKG